MLNRTKLIALCRDKVATRLSPSENLSAALEHGVPLFLQQLVETLRLENDLPVILLRQGCCPL